MLILIIDHETEMVLLSFTKMSMVLEESTECVIYYM